MNLECNCCEKTPHVITAISQLYPLKLTKEEAVDIELSQMNLCGCIKSILQL